MGGKNAAKFVLGMLMGLALAGCSDDEAADAGTGGSEPDAGTDAGYDVGAYGECYTRTEGETCNVTCECVMGTQCLDNGDGMRCLTVCTEDADCAEGDVCTDTELGFSVCVAGE